MLPSRKPNQPPPEQGFVSHVSFKKGNASGSKVTLAPLGEKTVVFPVSLSKLDFTSEGSKDRIIQRNVVLLQQLARNNTISSFTFVPGGFLDRHNQRLILFPDFMESILKELHELLSALTPSLEQNRILSQQLSSLITDIASSLANGNYKNNLADYFDHLYSNDTDYQNILSFLRDFLTDISQFDEIVTSYEKDRNQRQALLDIISQIKTSFSLPPSGYQNLLSRTYDFCRSLPQELVDTFQVKTILSKIEKNTLKEELEKKAGEAGLERENQWEDCLRQAYSKLNGTDQNLRYKSYILHWKFLLGTEQSQPFALDFSHLKQNSDLAKRYIVTVAEGVLNLTTRLRKTYNISPNTFTVLQKTICSLRYLWEECRYLFEPIHHLPNYPNNTNIASPLTKTGIRENLEPSDIKIIYMGDITPAIAASLPEGAEWLCAQHHRGQTPQDNLNRSDKSRSPDSSAVSDEDKASSPPNEPSGSPSLTPRNPDLPEGYVVFRDVTFTGVDGAPVMHASEMLMRSNDYLKLFRDGAPPKPPAAHSEANNL